MRGAMFVLVLAACDGPASSPDAAPTWSSEEVVAIDLPDHVVDGVAADERGVYWALNSDTQKRIMMLEADATEPVLLGMTSGDDDVTSFEVSLHHVVFTLPDLNGCTTGAFPLEGGALVQLAMSGGQSDQCRGLSTDGDLVTWTNTLEAGGGASVFRDDLGTADAAASLWTGTTAGVTAIDGASTYWIGDEAIWRHDGAAAELLHGPAEYVAIEGDALLWAVDGELFAASRGSFDGDGAVLASGLGRIDDLAADAEFVYALVDNLDLGDRIVRLLAIPRAGGELVELETSGADGARVVHGLAAWDGGVYYGLTIVDGSGVTASIQFASR